MGNKSFPLIYGTALVLFTAYISLDTFVLQKNYQTNATQINTAMFTKAASDTAATEPAAKPADAETVTAAQSQQHFSEKTAASPQITLTEYEEYNTHIYVADVIADSADVIKTAFADDTYGRNVTENTSQIAAAHNAILAVNGDNYGMQERGCVIRNGVVYRDSGGRNDVLCIDADGTMRVVSPDAYSAEALVEQGVWQAFSFGPGLVEDGQITVTPGQEVGKAKASNPRTAIGQISANHYIFVVSDGRTAESEGLSLYELAEFMQKLGAETAYNLDGGGSSTMYYNGEVVNQPTSGGRIKERSVSDIVYIG
ncbi:MAG: phosphodiester glycosidase family protein [Oscillospiraceae bacterium]|nr:phosphodiester glycosidase family protein [Oscillospiraceae bacterium]